MAIAGAEAQRNAEPDAEKRKYPGGAFDPLGFSKDSKVFATYCTDLGDIYYYQNYMLFLPRGPSADKLQCRLSNLDPLMDSTRASQLWASKNDSNSQRFAPQF